jgi:hypothetical protein
MIGQGNTQPATEQEKQQAQTMLKNIEQYLDDPKVYQTIVENLRNKGGDPADLVGSLVGQLIHSQVSAAESAGVQLSRDILIAVAAEVINAVIEMAMNEGLISIQSEEQLEQIQGDALVSAIDTYMSIGDPRVDEQAAGQVTQNVMQGQMDSPQAQQGMINNMVGGAV